MGRRGDIGTPSWDASRQRWRLSVQRDGDRKWFYSPIPGRSGQRECEDKAQEWLQRDPNEVHSDPLIAVIYEEWVAETHDTTSIKQAETYESLGRL